MRTFTTLLAAAIAAACGGSPSAPDTAGVRLTILTATDTIEVGASVDMRLQATYSDGRYATVQPLWTTDRPEIVNVKPLSASRQGDFGELEGWSKTGTIDHILFARVTGVSPGEAFVIAQCNLGTVRQPIRVTAQ